MTSDHASTLRSDIRNVAWRDGAALRLYMRARRDVMVSAHYNTHTRLTLPHCTECTQLHTHPYGTTLHANDPPHTLMTLHTVLARARRGAAREERRGAAARRGQGAAVAARAPPNSSCKPPTFAYRVLGLLVAAVVAELARS